MLPKKGVCACIDIAYAPGVRGLQQQLQQLHSTLISNPGDAVRMYQVVHKQIEASLVCLSKIQTRDSSQLSARNPPQQQKGMRALHVQTRRVASRSKSQGERDSLLRLVVQIVDDMRRLGLRIGATEVDSCVYALSRLGSYDAAIDTWQRCAAALDSEHASVLAQHSIKVMFPQTHTYALEAAVALRRTQLVCKVYRQGIGAMQTKRGSIVGPALNAQPIDASFFWCILSPRLKASDATQWRPDRLGSAFLTQVYQDATAHASSNLRLRCRIAQHLLRALFAEGLRHQAIQLYIELCNYRSEHFYRIPQNCTDSDSGCSGSIVTAEILCEVVGGLCRHSQLEEAYSTLCSADQNNRNIYTWNAYFDGLSNAIQTSKRMQDAVAVDNRKREMLEMRIREMEELDGILPDIVTRTIWMRACFRCGDWVGGEKCFSENLETMSSDVVCWDTRIRGLLESTDKEAVGRGWRLVGDLVSKLDGGGDAAHAMDGRLVETVLRRMLPRVSSRPRYMSPYEVLETGEILRIFEWAERNISADSGNLYEIIISSLICEDKIEEALEVHDTMCRRGVWSPRSVNCMIVRALAMPRASDAGENEGVARAISRAEEFIVAKIPVQQYAAAYFILLKLALQNRDYGCAWRLVDKHYPIARSAAGDKSGAPGAVSCVYPSETMYNTFLRLTKEHGNSQQHRLVLARMTEHINTIRQSHPAPARRIGRVH
ncbi:hypothetical protein H4S06_001277, partial [Coemansia sp. BCRC 34490]